MVGSRTGQDLFRQDNPCQWFGDESPRVLRGVRRLAYGWRRLLHRRLPRSARPGLLSGANLLGARETNSIEWAAGGSLSLANPSGTYAKAVNWRSIHRT